MKKLDITREVKIGLFALVTLLCLYLGVNYLKGKELLSSDRTYYSLFDSTGGLQTTSPVLLRGVKVGRVTEIALDAAHPDKVMVTMRVKKSVAIPTDSHVKLFASDIMGNKALEIVPGTSPSHFEKHAVIPSAIESGLLDVAGASIEDLALQAAAVMRSFTAAADNINAILESNTASITGALQNIQSVTRQLSGADLGGMLRRIDGVVGNLDRATGSLAEANLKATLDTLGMSIGHLNGVLGKLSDGGGTASKLLDDPALYDSLTLAAGNLSVLLEDLKANPGRYVHLSLFGAKKEKTPKAPKEKKK